MADACPPSNHSGFVVVPVSREDGVNATLTGVIPDLKSVAADKVKGTSGAVPTHAGHIAGVHPLFSSKGSFSRGTGEAFLQTLSRAYIMVLTRRFYADPTVTVPILSPLSLYRSSGWLYGNADGL